MLRKILPHGAIIISLMYFVFFFIDRVNTAMAFINNGMTKTLLFILCVISIINAVLMIADDRKRARARRRQNRQPAAPQQRPVQQRVPQQRPAVRYDYDRRAYDRREYESRRYR